jgi:CRP-like cAMP-binding protein
MSSRVIVIPDPPTPHEALTQRGARFVPSTPQERADALESTPWNLRLSWKEEQGIGAYLRMYELNTGTLLFSEGDRDAFVALVVSGAIQISKHDSADHIHSVARLGGGKMVGEMSLIDGAPRSATAMAAEPTRLLVLTHDDFERMSRDRPDLALKYALMIAEALAQLLRQTTGALVDHLPEVAER